VQLLHAAFEDLGQGTARLRQLMDSFLLIRHIDTQTDWEIFFVERHGEGFERVAVNVLALMTTLFDGDREWPRLAAAIDRRAALVTDASRSQARHLLSAPRKHPANFLWFASLYPGSIAAYLAWFWYHGFPANMSPTALARVIRTVPGLVGGRTVRRGGA
jgi:hypothetical protein